MKGPADSRVWFRWALASCGPRIGPVVFGSLKAGPCGLSAPQAVCCEDEQHCCPEGTQCDVRQSRCVSAMLGYSPMLEKLRARRRPGGTPDHSTTTFQMQRYLCGLNVFWWNHKCWITPKYTLMNDTICNNYADDTDVTVFFCYHDMLMMPEYKV